MSNQLPAVSNRKTNVFTNQYNIKKYIRKGKKSAQKRLKC